MIGAHAMVSPERDVQAGTHPPDLPLFVDLDGTLIRSDLLWESLLLLARQHPRAILRIPAWLAKGRAYLKARVADHVQPRAHRLCYRPEVIDYLTAARAAGRRVVLASASDERLVQAVAEHVGCVDDALGSDGTTNLRGTAKLARIRADVEAHEGVEHGFEYVGDSAADLPVWRGAERVTTVAPSSAALQGLAGRPGPRRDLVAPASSLPGLVRALRPHQWSKNLLLFVPLVLAHELANGPAWVRVGAAFVAFCLVASAGYLINDLLDIEADRGHPRKRARPLAAGTLPVPLAAVMVPVLLGAAFLLAGLATPLAFVAMLAGYLALTLVYSWYLKEQPLVDVLVLAVFYTHRVLAGGIAADVEVSPWLLAFSSFLFLSLALAKRYVELTQRAGGPEGLVTRRAYHASDTDLLSTMGVASGYLSVLVLFLFVSSERVTQLYARPDVLWLLGPVMFYWVSRIWFLARRGELHHDPVVFTQTDPVSFVCGVLIAVVALAAAL